MKWVQSLFTQRFTWLILGASILACVTTLTYHWRMHQNMMLFGLIISFPLVFSIQAAFKRRERSLEYFSLFRSGLTSTIHACEQGKEFSKESKSAMDKMMKRLSEQLMDYLRTGEGDPRQVYGRFDVVSKFLVEHREEIPARTRLRVGRYMRDVYASVSFLTAIKTHRTAIGIRIMSYVFVTLFPFIQAPVVAGAFEGVNQMLIVCLVSFLGSITLASLLLIQKQLEDPFDVDGLDDLRMEHFDYAAAD